MCHCENLENNPIFFVLCPEPQQHSVITPPFGRHTETTKYIAECATGYGRQEPFHGDGGNEACGHSSYATH